MQLVLLVRVDPTWSYFIFCMFCFSYQLIRPPVGQVMLILFLVGLVESSRVESESESVLVVPPIYRLLMVNKNLGCILG